MSYTNGLDDPTIFFNILTYTGDDSAKAFTGVGFAPDFNWTKVRSNGGSDQFTHQLADSVRGTGKTLWSSENDAESSNYSNGYINAFGSDGYTVTAGDSYNGVGRTYVSWNWKAGGSASSNSNGSITSSVSANTTAGFSIVSYTGTGSNATIGHGLGSAPQVVLLKERNGTNNWLMSHQPLSASLGDYTRFMTLNSTAAVSGAGNIVFQGSAFTSSVFNVGASAASNGSSQTFIAYCFAEKKGYSKFGSYVGNGNSDGTFVYTGFRPAFLMIKNASTGSTYWTICDSKRDGFNDNNHRLFANLSDAESTSNPWVMYSNGFKMTTTGSYVNSSGDTYIYMAFAEQPFVNSSGVPNNAR